MIELRPTICRMCLQGCGLVVEVEDGRATRITGDAANPVFQGYSCVKGRQHLQGVQHPKRLLQSLKRTADGSYQRIGIEDALDEIADRLTTIVDRHGPRSLAMYMGGMSMIGNPATHDIGLAFVKEIGTPMFFRPSGIDQPGKDTAVERHGRWLPGGYSWQEADVAMLVGINPFVSHWGWGIGSPKKAFKEATARGCAFIVIDPRRSESAQRATIHLQPRPGHDVAILAAMCRTIISEGLIDREFIAENVSGLAGLQAAVERFTPEIVARSAGVAAEDIVAAARMFAAARRAYAVAGTGANMGNPGTLLEYLVLCLDTLCGHRPRPGDPLHKVRVLLPGPPPRAQAVPPSTTPPQYSLRVRDIPDLYLSPRDYQLQAAALAEEILTPGEGQVRAVLSMGGNPVGAWPDQLKTIKAFRSLDLLVQVDIQMSATAKLADYVLAPKMALEMPIVSLMGEGMNFRYNASGWSGPYAQYCPPAVEAPRDAELVEDWEIVYGLAQRMGLQLTVAFPSGPYALDMDVKPSSDELYDQMCAGGRVRLSEVKRHPHGVLFDEPPTCVQPKEEGWTGRLELADPEMVAALAQTPLDEETVDAAYPFRLISRRVLQVFNTPTFAVPEKGPNSTPYNPAHLNPADIADLGLAPGDLAEVSSSRGTIRAVVAADDTVRRGVVSMSHSYGGGPERDHEVRAIGSTTNRLIADDEVYDPQTGQPRMSAVPVAVRPLPARVPVRTDAIRPAEGGGSRSVDE